ncbi:xylose isomerase-like [Orbicella faveolata]|uniref:xylose isomerase-like n=1 Tax=Orbicella faveolata TaxID=48498 RepID=UPI0009E2C3F6|nr:xylose isomerase-like [Orbicella faveolata]
MSSFAPPSKKARRSRSNGTPVDSDGEFFPGISKIEYKPDAGPGDNLCFKHYNPQEVVMGKTMEDWCRFSVCFWHTFRGTGADPFGFPTISRHWDDGSNSLENAKRRLQAAFEFFEKLGVKYYTFHDRDIAPEGENLEETNANLDQLTDLALELQEKTGVKLLWATCNLFANPRYMNGAASNPDAHAFAHAAAQVKKGLEIAKKLGAENFVFWGGREGYHTLLNTDVRRELDHMGRFFQMVVDYKGKIGFTGQLLIEPKPKEPTKHQYDYDAQTVIAFLKTYGLEDDFKLNIEPNHTTLAGHCYEHDVVVASKFGFLGSIDSNTGSPDLGWDTDQFPMDIKNCTFVMKTIIEQGGLAPGGLNFDCKIRRESTDLEDMFIAHIGAMDSFARGLKNAAKLIEDGTLDSLVKERYSSFDEGIGAKIEKGTTSLEELEAFIVEHGEPKLISGKQEKCEAIVNYFV